MHNEKGNHSKEIRLAEKAECSWQAFPPVGEQVCQQSSSAKGRGLAARWAKEKCAWPFPTITCMSPCYLENECMDRSGGSGHGEGCAITSIASVRSGQAASTVGVADTDAHWWMSTLLWQSPYAPYAHTPCSKAHHTVTEQFPSTLEHLKDEPKGLQGSFLLPPFIQLKLSCLCKL